MAHTRGMISTTVGGRGGPSPGETQEQRRPQTDRHPRKRRSWKRWLANLMIIAGVLLLAYPLGTWGYTWFQQRELRQRLASDNPQLTAAAAELDTTDFVLVDTKPDNTVGLTTTTTVDAAAVAAAAAEAERLAALESFRAEAEDFSSSVGGKGGEPIGRILIPSVGIDVVMIEGVGKNDLREGPGHWPETPFPGEGGNFVVSGHRTTYGAPFMKLGKVEEGDEIIAVLPYAIARYEVIRVIIVYPDEVEEVAQLGREQISLAACHPMYSAKQRIVVQGDLVGFKLIETES